MSRTVFCTRLKQELEGLVRPPYPGELGHRIYEHISKQSWQDWLHQQTMLINENRITPIDPKARAFLVEQMEKFLFAGDADKPAGYVPVDDGPA